MTKQNKSKNRNLWLFFVIAFAWSWLLWMPEVLLVTVYTLPRLDLPWLLFFLHT